MAELANWDPSSDPLMQTMGFVRTISIDTEIGLACIEFEAKQNQCHSGNVVQGGFVTGWIDNAMATAVLAKTNFERTVMSLDLKISFYRSANPGLVVAEAWIERIGKRTAFTEGLLRTPDGKIIAKGSATIALMTSRPRI